MTLQALKAEVEALSPEERKRLTAFLVALRHKDLEGYRDDLARRIDDTDPENWVGVEELDKRLES